MFRFFTLLMCLCIEFSCLAQTTSFIKQNSYKLIRKGQTWALQNVELTPNATILTIDVIITNNDGGSFSFPSSIYISGLFGKYYVQAMTIGDSDWDIGRWYSYAKKQQGKAARCKLYFARIPKGIDYINYCEPNFISWKQISIEGNTDNSIKTSWTEQSLKEHWSKNGCSSIEGIYDIVSSNNVNFWGRNSYRFAIVKANEGFDCIYIKGSNPIVWKEGEVKSHFTSTAAENVYKPEYWLLDTKVASSNLFISFESVGMHIYDNSSNVADFLKIYTATQRAGNSGTARSDDSMLKGTGSGFFVGSNIIATNFHVVDHASQLKIQINRDNKVEQFHGEVLCSDKTNDLALVIIKDPRFVPIKHLPYALSQSSRDVGSSIFTMGYPMSNIMGDEVKVTDGIISSKTGFEGDIVTYQISAAIQPGNSGGALFDKDGNVVGITNAGIPGAQNVGYAIKSSYLCNLIESAPINMKIPNNNELSNVSLTEKIKTLSKYVVLIKIY